MAACSTLDRRKLRRAYTGGQEGRSADVAGDRCDGVTAVQISVGRARRTPASRPLCAVGLLGEAGAADVAAPSRQSAMLGRRQAHRPTTRRSWAVAHPYGRARPARAGSLHHFRAIRALFSRRTTAVPERGRGADAVIMHGGLVVTLTYAVGEQQAIRPGVTGSQRFPAAARAGALTDHSSRILPSSCAVALNRCVGVRIPVNLVRAPLPACRC
jgi:hypothetical protein